MEIKIAGKTKELRFSYNSFKYLEDFDISVVEDMEKKPFKLMRLTKELLFAACNHEKKDYIDMTFVEAYVENSFNERKLSGFFEELFSLLTESPFFPELPEETEETEAKPKK